MSREAKIFQEEKRTIGKRVKEYESFGWELLSINGEDVSMSRETQNPVYADLVKYEYTYEELQDQQRRLIRPVKPRLDVGIMFLLLLLVVIPGIIYIIIKMTKKDEYEKAERHYQMEWKRLSVEITKTCNESRATFFSIQQMGINSDFKR